MVDEEDPFLGFDPTGLDADKQMATCAALVIDWIGNTKSTWVSAEDVWAMCETICSRSDFPIFHRVKQLVKDYMEGRMERIGMCPSGHVAYYDCKHPLLQDPKYQNADATECPVCGEERYLPRKVLANGELSPQIEVKVGWL
jgi:hypothetical protein